MYSDYEIINVFSASERAWVCRAKAKKDGRDCVLKVCEPPTPADAGQEGLVGGTLGPDPFADFLGAARVQKQAADRWPRRFSPIQDLGPADAGGYFYATD